MKKERRYLWCAAIFTSIWVLIFGAYFLAVPELFFQMEPNEFGDLLAGWFSPLAMVWIIVAVLLQREQLEKQKEELGQNTEALVLQAEELGRTVQELEKQTGHMKQESRRREIEFQRSQDRALGERLMYGIERLARLGRGLHLQNPTEKHAKQGLGLFGRVGQYEELWLGGQAHRGLENLSEHLELLEEKLGQGWSLSIELEEIDEITAALGASRKAVQNLLSDGSSGELGEGPRERLELLSRRLRRARDLMGQIRTELDESSRS